MTDRADELPLRTRTTNAWAERHWRSPGRSSRTMRTSSRRRARARRALLPAGPTSGAERLPDSPEGEAREAWTRVLTGVARDEIEHLGLVLRILKAPRRSPRSRRTRTRTPPRCAGSFVKASAPTTCSIGCS